MKTVRWPLHHGLIAIVVLDDPADAPPPSPVDTRQVSLELDWIAGDAPASPAVEERHGSR